MSPTMATVRPAKVGLAGQRAEVPAHREGVQQRLGRVLVGAVARVEHLGVDAELGEPAAGLPGSPGGVVPDDQGVHAHGRDGQHGVPQRLALGDRGPLGADVDHVRRQPLAGQLEGGPGPGRVLEEQVDHRTSAQRRQLLHRAALDQGHLLGQVDDLGDLRLVQVGRGQQVVHQTVSSAQRVAGHDGDLVDSVDLGQPDPDPLAGPGRDVLAHVVGPDRQLAVATVHQHGQPDRPRPAEVAQGIQGGPHRTAGVEHVIDQHHDPVVHRAGTSVWPTGRVGCRRRSSRYMVTSSAPTGISVPSTSAIAAASRWAKVTPRVGMPSSTSPSAPRFASRIWCAIRAQARAIWSASRTRRPASAG